MRLKTQSSEPQRKRSKRHARCREVSIQAMRNGRSLQLGGMAISSMSATCDAITRHDALDGRSGRRYLDVSVHRRHRSPLGEVSVDRWRCERLKLTGKAALLQFLVEIIRPRTRSGFPDPAPPLSRPAGLRLDDNGGLYQSLGGFSTPSLLLKTHPRSPLVTCLPVTVAQRPAPALSPAGRMLQRPCSRGQGGPPPISLF